jgi:cyclophilin family peptidyl-prolyl cis-trans isomerase
MNIQTGALSRLAAFVLLTCISFPHTLAAQDNPSAIIHTSMGDIQLELYRHKAPVTVENFINYANSGFYDGTIFHRVISGFMIQGGGFTADMQKKTTGEAIRNEAKDGFSNQRGSIAMARTNNPHSATAQFFINVQDNANLDYRGERNSSEWGYTVFGQVTSGIQVVDKIRFVQTTSQAQFSDVPVEPVVIDNIEIIDD